MSAAEHDGRRFHTGDCAVDVIVHGYPGKSVCHGSLGFSTIALLRAAGRIALVDVGAFGQRGLLIDGLAAHGLVPGDVTDVLLTHSHYDHAINWVLFPDADIVIGEAELDWSLRQPWGETPVPELYVERLASWPRLRRVADGDTVLPGVTAHASPGHTPGSLIYVFDVGPYELVFTGDACKNRAELLSRSAAMTLDAHASRASFELVWKLWRRRTGNVLVPGHDLPLVLDADEARYLGTREAAIEAWLGDDLNRTTVFSLHGERSGAVD